MLNWTRPWDKLRSHKNSILDFRYLQYDSWGNRFKTYFHRFLLFRLPELLPAESAASGDVLPAPTETPEPSAPSSTRTCPPPPSDSASVLWVFRYYANGFICYYGLFENFENYYSVGEHGCGIITLFSDALPLQHLNRSRLLLLEEKNRLFFSPPQLLR